MGRIACGGKKKMRNKAKGFDYICIIMWNEDVARVSWYATFQKYIHYQDFSCSYDCENIPEPIWGTFQL